MSLDLAILCRIATRWKELPDRAEDRLLQSKGAAERWHCTEESFSPLWGLGFSTKILLSSVACGDTNGRALRCSLCVQAMLTY